MNRTQLEAGQHVVVTGSAYTGIIFDQASYDAVVKHCKKSEYRVYPTLVEAETAYGTSGVRSLVRGDGSIIPPHPRSNRGSRKASKKKRRAANKGTKAVKQPMYGNDIVTDNVDVHIFCDGSCYPNPGPAASAMIIYRGLAPFQLFYGCYENGTNNTAELKAVRMALQAVSHSYFAERRVQILTDSTYTLGSVLDRAPKWSLKGWDTKAIRGKKNVELIREVYELYLRVESQVEFAHIKAHSGVEGNEIADILAELARTDKVEDPAEFTDINELESRLPKKLRKSCLASIRTLSNNKGVSDE